MLLTGMEVRMRRKLALLILFILVGVSLVVAKRLHSRAPGPPAREPLHVQLNSPLTSKTSAPPAPTAVTKLPETVKTAEYVDTFKEAPLSSPQALPVPSVEVPPIPLANVSPPSPEPTAPAVVISDKITPLAVSPSPPPQDATLSGSGGTGTKKPVNLWSISIEQTDGKDVVRATMGKRGGIKLTCDRVDLQTVNDFFQAQGNVVLSGNNLQCRCDKLTIRLNEDCLFLEGKAHVGLHSPKGEDASQPLLVELKGEQFALRWPDLRVETPEPPAAVGPVEPKNVVPDTTKSPE
jgi:hypothetical protein